MFWEVWGDVLGGLVEGFGRKTPGKNLHNTYKITLLISISIFAVLIFYLTASRIPPSRFFLLTAKLLTAKC